MGGSWETAIVETPLDLLDGIDLGGIRRKPLDLPVGMDNRVLAKARDLFVGPGAEGERW